MLSLPQPHPEPLRDTAVSALFGDGDDARRTLIKAWLAEGRVHMRMSAAASNARTIQDVLISRLRYNEPVLGLLPEVRILLIIRAESLSPYSGVRHARHSVWFAFTRPNACSAARSHSGGRRVCSRQRHVSWSKFLTVPLVPKLSCFALDAMVCSASFDCDRIHRGR